LFTTALFNIPVINDICA